MIWHDEVAHLRPPVTGKPLTVGIWLEEDLGFAWIRQAIVELRQAAWVRVAAVFFHAGDTPPEVPALYQRLQQKCRARIADDPFVTVDLRPALEDIPVLGLETAPASGLDVLIRLSVRPGSGECRGWARYGVWSVGFGDPARYPAAPFYFWEILGKDRVSTLLLYLHEERLEEARILYRYESATRFNWNIVLNTIEPFSMAPVMVVRRLRDLQQYGWERIASIANETAAVRVNAQVRYPNLLRVGWFVASKLCRGVYNRYRFRRGHARWFVSLRKRPASPPVRLSDLRGFRPVPNPPGTTLADPFLIEYRGTTYLLVEQIVTETSTGYLAACAVSSDGTPGKFVETMREAYHMSYPCVFCWGDVIYLLPESSANRSVDLYRAVDFPRTWKLEKTLQQNTYLVDTTPFFHEGVWYFFTSTVEDDSGNWVELWLFYTDRLDGEWHYHPHNPICSDVRRARGAGHLFEWNGKLIRPAQDCSLRYGYALVFNEVLKLSPAEYEEKPVEVIFPTWMPGIFATHTWNASADFEAIDATRIPQ